MPRDILQVIDNVIDVIPRDCDDYEIIKTGLVKIKHSVFYTAEENMNYRWQQLGFFLNNLMGPYKNTPWGETVFTIITGRDIEKKKNNTTV